MRDDFANFAKCQSCGAREGGHDDRVLLLFCHYCKLLICFTCYRANGSKCCCSRREPQESSSDAG